MRNSFSPPPILMASAALALLAAVALSAALAVGGPRSSTTTVTTSLPSPSSSPSSATSDPAAYYAGRAMTGNGDFAVSQSQAEALGNQIPRGAQVDRKSNTLRFTASTVRFAVVASPPGADMAFRVAGMRDPTIEVPAGAQVTVQFVNGDSDMAHMWLLGARLAAARPLGDPSGAGQPGETISFTARPAGSYHYFCAFPGHAAQGMQGRLVVEPA